MYTHDVDILAEQLIRPNRRKPMQLAWVKLLTSALKNVYNDFISTVASIDEIIAYNGQVCYLQDALRNRFCSANPTWITLSEPVQKIEQIILYNEADDGEDEFFFNEADELDELFEEHYLYNTDDFIRETDFYVLINNASLLNSATIADINNMVAMYAAAGKNWLIVDNT